MPKHIETKVFSKEIYKGYVFTVTKDDILLENGKAATREIVHHNANAAAVVALNSKGEIALVRQFRYAVGKEMLEIPAGKLDEGEEPLQSAKRELEEEVGYIAENFVSFGKIFPTCAYCTEEIYIYAASSLTKTKQHLDEDEFLDVLWLPFEDAVAMVINCEIEDSKTIGALLRTKVLIDTGKFSY